MLPSLYPGEYGELEPESFFVWLDGLGQQRCNRDVTLGPDCQAGLYRPRKWFPFAFSPVSIFFDVLPSFGSVVPFIMLA